MSATCDQLPGKKATSESGDADGNAKPEAKVRFDWLISNRLGEFGKYQSRVYLLLGLPAISCAMHALSWVFLGANVNHRCQLLDENASNSSYFVLPHERRFDESFPWENSSSTGVSGRWSQCEKYEESRTLTLEGNLTRYTIDPGVSTDHETEPITEISLEGYEGGPLSSNNLSHKELSRVSCNGKYIFDNSQYKSSARADFQLICDSTVWYTVAETLFKSGILVGAILFGSLSDRVGRRPVFFYALCQQVTCGIIASIAPNYAIFVTARFLIGMANSGVFLVAFVIAMELVGKRKRMVAGIGMQYFFAIGYLVVGFLAYLIRDWRYLQFSLSIPGLLFLSYYWFMPESIRWLLIHGRKEEAIKILRKAALINHVQIPENELTNLNEEEKSPERPSGIREILSYRRTILRSINIFFCWFVNSGVYYGLALNSGNLGGNDYVNFILSGAVEVPAYAFLLLTLNRFGRKRVLCGCMLSAGIFLIACGFTPSNMTWLMVTLNMLGKLFNAAGYAAIYMFAAELFPTVIRNSFMGISSVMARVGGILSDYVILMQYIWKPLPHLIFGTVSLTSGMLSLLLPETLGRRLPETMEDGEKFGTSSYDNDNTIDGRSPLSAKTEKNEKESRF